MFEVRSTWSQPIATSAECLNWPHDVHGSRRKVLPTLPNLKSRLRKASIVTYSEAPANPKLCLRVAEATKQLRIMEPKRLVLEVHTIVLDPAKEKFLPGFAQYDAPVGLPTSPLITTSPASFLPEPSEELFLNEESTMNQQHRQNSTDLQDSSTSSLSASSTSSVSSIDYPLKLELKSSPSYEGKAVHHASHALTKSITPPPISGLSHSDQEVLRLRIRSSFSAFYRDFSSQPVVRLQKSLVYILSDRHNVVIPWTPEIEYTFKRFWQLMMAYDRATERNMPAQMMHKERVSYRTVALGLLCSELSSDALCRVWDRNLAYVSPVRRAGDLVEGWLSFTEFIVVVWATGMTTLSIHALGTYTAWR